MTLFEYLSVTLDILKKLELLESQQLAIANAVADFEQSDDREQALASLHQMHQKAKETHAQVFELCARLH